jgi:hypothetical protein
MTNKVTVHPIKKVLLGAFPAKSVMATLLSTWVFVQPANAAEQEWWFDVEVILFERDVDAVKLSEKFKQSQLESSTNDVVDLLTPYLNPDLSYLRAGLPYCSASNQLAVKEQYEQDFAFPMPADETNELSSSQLNEQQDQGQTPQVDQSLAVNTDTTSEESFQYEVATTDIFAQSNDAIPLAQTTDAEDISPSNLEQNNSAILDQQINTGLAPEINIVRPPIEVEFIEWQIPSEFLCAYAELIDPSFAAITSLHNDVSGTQPPKHIKRVPDIINGMQWQKKRSAFLLPTSNMQMSDLYNKINKQRDITPILHLKWRQEVKFGRDKGQTFRLFAGENFAEQFDVNGMPLVDDTDSLFDSLSSATDESYIPEQELVGLTPEQQQVLLARFNDTSSEAVTEDLFARIATALEDDTPIKIEYGDVQTEQQTPDIDPAMLKELWQLDGGITVYLRNIGRIPYLHIDSNLDFRQPMFDPKQAPQITGSSDDVSKQGAIVVNPLQQAVSLQPNYLHSVNFNQLRRVISKQVHYFDHPLFGMVVRIDRYRWPEAEQETDIN